METEIRCKHYQTTILHDGMGWAVKCLECGWISKHYQTKARMESEWNKIIGKARI